MVNAEKIRNDELEIMKLSNREQGGVGVAMGPARSARQYDLMFDTLSVSSAGVATGDH